MRMSSKIHYWRLLANFFMRLNREARKNYFISLKLSLKKYCIFICKGSYFFDVFLHSNIAYPRFNKRITYNLKAKLLIKPNGTFSCIAPKYFGLFVLGVALFCV